MSELIPMSSPDIDEADIQAVRDVVASGRLASGPKAEEFERSIAEYVGVEHAVAVSSGTAALHLAVRALEIGPGDEVLVPSFTFAATVNALLYEGAVPVFVEIEPQTLCIDPKDLEEKITPAAKAVMAVDILGHPADWDEILRVAGEHGLKVIDDSCEALGAQYKGKKIGRFGDAAAFAFYPNKQITTGEGGMVVTDDKKIADLCRSMRNHGRGETGAWLEHERLGYNYRMSEMSAALGVSQLRRIETFLAKREQVARMYTEALERHHWIRPMAAGPDVRMSWFVYVAALAEDLERDSIMRAMQKKGVPTRAYFPPVHLQSYIKDRFGYRGGELPVTESVARRTIALPFHNNLSEKEVGKVVEVLVEAADRA